MINIDKYEWPELVNCIPDEEQVRFEMASFYTQYWALLTLENEKTR